MLLNLLWLAQICASSGALGHKSQCNSKWCIVMYRDRVKNMKTMIWEVLTHLGFRMFQGTKLSAQVEDCPTELSKPSSSSSTNALDSATAHEVLLPKSKRVKGKGQFDVSLTTLKPGLNVSQAEERVTAWCANCLEVERLEREEGAIETRK